MEVNEKIMSHFTHMTTSFQNLFYLQKALNKLQIEFKLKQIKTEHSNSSHVNLIISQSNNSNIEFCWNAHEYELVLDVSLWKQDSPIQSFIDRIAQQYAQEVVIGESQKIGFQPVKYQQNSDGSNTLVLERWNN